MVLNSLKTYTFHVFEKGFSKIIPLDSRKKMVIAIDLQNWLPGSHTLPIMILRDWAEKDADSFHRFLWGHHLAYAKYYEKVNDFEGNLLVVRRIFFEDLMKIIARERLQSGDFNVQSIFEVGCSSGYLLRFMETKLFTKATIIEGIDIDTAAIEQGLAYLAAHRSKIQLKVEDMANLDRVLSRRKYDLIVCAGVLMYLQEKIATSVVRSMLEHCNGIVAIAGLAHPDIDNAKLGCSEPRKSDGALIHNIDAMVENAGGKIEFHRWEGSKTFDEQTVYFVFCRPKPD